MVSDVDDTKYLGLVQEPVGNLGPIHGLFDTPVNLNAPQSLVKFAWRSYNL